MKWHLTIKDNETGETVQDLDVCAIIAGIGTENGERAMAMANCTGGKVVATALAAEDALQNVYDENPIAKHLTKLAKAKKALAETETETENENEND